MIYKCKLNVQTVITFITQKQVFKNIYVYNQDVSQYWKGVVFCTQVIFERI